MLVSPCLNEKSHTSIWKPISDGRVREKARQRFADLTGFLDLPGSGGRLWCPLLVGFLKPPLCVSEAEVGPADVSREEEEEEEEEGSRPLHPHPTPHPPAPTQDGRLWDSLLRHFFRTRPRIRASAVNP